MRLITIFAAVAAFLATPALAQEEDADIAGVRAAVMAYVVAGNTGDPELAAEAFYTSEGVMFIRREDGEEGEDRVDPMNLGDFAARFGNPAGERVTTFRDISIVEGVLAYAHIHIAWPDSDREVDDMFLLYKIEGEWKIVAKAFDFH
jgi:hypothetical protein